MLDSGAFSAWNKGAKINLDAYITYILAYQQHLEAYVNLDVIPGEFGRVPTYNEVEASAQASWDNMVYMESYGLQPMPVFHQGEDFKWLARMISHGCVYVGISPANDRTTAQKRVWLDRVFHAIGDADGVPVVKTHAFGVTSVPLLYRYPWFSVDSTSWMLFGVYGAVLVPVWSGGKFCFDRSPEVVAVSEKSTAREFEGKHLDSYTETVQAHIFEYFDSIDTQFEKLRVDGNERSYVNGRFFLEVERHHNVTRFVRQQEIFF